MAKKLLQGFVKKNCKRQIKQFRIEKVRKRKGVQLYVKWKSYSICLNDGLVKKLLYKTSYCPETDSHNKSKKQVELDLSKHATKFDIKKQQVLAHKYSQKSDLTSSKSDVDELDIDKSKKLFQLFWITKTDVYKSDITKLQAIPVDLQKI